MNTSKIPIPKRGRPPKVARENQDTRAELIRSGVELLTEQGFFASGIDKILKKVGVPKGSFYHYFASKEVFGRAVIESYASYFAKKLDSHLLNSDIDPIQRISNFVEDAKSGMQKHQYKRGCLVGNLGQEVDVLPESYRQLLLNIFTDWQARIEACLLEAQQQKLISAKANCQLQAEFFWVGWEGAVSRARLVQDAEPLNNFLSQFIAGLPR
ncbi:MULTISPECIES: acrylate utilization transcriptional regulator AcuR [Aliiglaciecola]|nr:MULTISPECIES: TetR/AcrR family transcriptional regulator [Aliiglaciecola]MBU2878847.1 TetR/AcrR family transcriptional regulator [Aliiglaciecola lipolytica]MDO6711254.1 TetR/AcrR family transcriptional regulator [Aliiglaciecola sp. 2_MG-2023]MDO6752297.1 TetR/AcrR family transcriptional regulator [Aliiglaciecola sp. 1_MG-2023]